MAYAEKRGKGPQAWRVKYRLPGGGEASESGFETKAAALAWGRDQEARIREGRWTDERREDHGQRMDRPVAGHPGCRHQHAGQPRVPDPPVHPPRVGCQRAELAQHRGDHPMGERPARQGRDLRADRPRRPHPARHRAGRRGRHPAAADPVHPRAAAPQPRAPDRPQARTRDPQEHGRRRCRHCCSPSAPR